MISIHQLSKEIGIAVDTLRVWERRYGFPAPRRDSRGHRLYPEEQVEELRVVKKLKDLGYRPQEILSLSPQGRRNILEERVSEVRPGVSLQSPGSSLQTLLEGSPDEIAEELRRRLQELGLLEFIHQVALPLIQALDRGWTEGSIGIAREHLISDRLEELLKERLQRSPSIENRPRVLFLTLSGERHKLGLLLSALFFQQEGIECLWLNEELPLLEVPPLAEELRLTGVALSFSAHYPARQAKLDVANLRNHLDPAVLLIAGGQGVSGGISMQNVHVCTDLKEIPGFCARYLAQKKKGKG